MKRIRIYGLFAVVLVICGAWWFSPTHVIKRRTQALLTTLTLEGGTGRVGRQMATYSLNTLLASEVELETPTLKEANGTFERAELESVFSWLCEQAKQTRFKLEDFKAVTISGDKAKVELTLNGLVELPTYRPADGTYEVAFDWEKDKDGWRLRRASWTQVR